MAARLLTDLTAFDGRLNERVLGAAVRHVHDLQACARDQQEAMQELREAITRLQQDLQRPRRAVRPRPVTAAEHKRP